MKVALAFAVLVAVCSGSAIPLTPGDNSHYVEGKSRYIWMPDGEGVPHLVDLHQPVDYSALNSRNGANNQYWLFTRQNPTNRQIITFNNAASVTGSNYSGTRGLKVIVHGWNNNGDTAMNPLITSAFLAVQDVNVIVVDWRQLASNPNYNTAAAGVPSVGQHLGNFLVWLINTGGGNWNNVHLVGFSLGAHVVGVAGRQAGGKPSRVTGLDAAGPGWTSNSNALNANSGRYVEAVHTNGGGLGIWNNIGNADFYPNGGQSQPGCGLSTCSHGRANDLFASSVRQSNRFVSNKCSNLSQAQSIACTGATLAMGNGVVSKSGSGIYGLRTGNIWPF